MLTYKQLKDTKNQLYKIMSISKNTLDMITNSAVQMENKDRKISKLTDGLVSIGGGEDKEELLSRLQGMRSHQLIEIIMAHKDVADSLIKNAPKTTGN